MGKVFIYALLDGAGRIGYVGKTVNLAQRMKDHRRKKAWAVRHRVLEEVEGETWRERERFWIAQFREIGTPLVNICEGGMGASGFSHTEEAKAKIRAYQSSPEAFRIRTATHLGRKQSTDERAMRSARRKGYKASAEAIANQVASRRNGKGWVYSAATRIKMSIAHKGKKLSSEHLASLRAAHQQPEFRQKISAANRGRVASPEARRNYLLAVRRRKERGGFRQSPEAIEKMRQARLKNPIRAWLGKKLPESIRENMRKAWVLRKQKQTNREES